MMVSPHPVLYLDTLKVSTIEQTAEEGELVVVKGNALILGTMVRKLPLLLKDALFSAKSMAIMFGNGSVDDYNDELLFMKTEQFILLATLPAEGTSLLVGIYEGPDGTRVNP